VPLIMVHDKNAFVRFVVREHHVSRVGEPSNPWIEEGDARQDPRHPAIGL